MYAFKLGIGMLRRGGYAGVDKGAVREMRAGLAGRAFEGEDGEAGRSGVGCYDAVVIVSGGVVDGCDDEVTGLGNVLRED